MNVIDIVILLILLYAIYSGARDGLIIQGVSIVGIALGVWLGSRWCYDVAVLFKIGGEHASVWGFVIILLATILLVAIAARVIRGVLKFAGFGLLDKILGVGVSVCKFVIIMSIIFSLFDIVNHSFDIVKLQELEQSKLYRPIESVSDLIGPVWDWTQNKLEI